ncbi:hypothetical protein LHK_01949 [Laribacter hongkongensis HLHK9]|uniref:Uncharacterized protein n=1 Tax=Laribacter hongkongensis (strain HLHK9) TaxID=557598 RepID=C1D8Z1_LARHH|nr:hypothetical protein LHK_01949 [Laribacter hongkongensis HLHK9]
MLLQAPCQPCGPARGVSRSGCSQGKATMRTMMVPRPAEGMPAGNRPGQVPGTGLYRVAPRGVLGQASRKCSCCSWACFHDPKEIPRGTMEPAGRDGEYRSRLAVQGGAGSRQGWPLLPLRRTDMAGKAGPTGLAIIGNAGPAASRGSGPGEGL